MYESRNYIDVSLKILKIKKSVCKIVLLLFSDLIEVNKKSLLMNKKNYLISLVFSLVGLLIIGASFKINKLDNLVNLSEIERTISLVHIILL